MTDSNENIRDYTVTAQICLSSLHYEIYNIIVSGKNKMITVASERIQTFLHFLCGIYDFKTAILPINLLLITHNDKWKHILRTCFQSSKLSEGTVSYVC